MSYYFKPNKKSKLSPYKTLSPPDDSINLDYITLIPYLIALQIPVAFKLATKNQAFIPSTSIQIFEHNHLILSNQMSLDVNQIAAMIFSFNNDKSLQRYLRALTSYLDSTKYQAHMLKPTFDYLRAMNQKITSIFYHDLEIFSKKPPKTIQRCGNTTAILSYEEDHRFYFTIISLNHITTYDTLI